MSWPMPTPGPWNAAMALTPDMSTSNYTPDQWQAMQQQNWQQWTQWQQQYAQWHSQYGEKYAQMQAVQSMGIMPPLPVGGVPPPAPPPPEKPPPPPPPHENDQPLYGAPPVQPVPVPAPTPTSQHINVPQNNTGYNNTNYAGSNQNWSKPPPMKANVQQLSSQANNTDALKKLAEEERLFDIQFKKWEEEIEKWKQENVNHPDKQAYKEYESKFEACRVQLLERRQQMKQKRARLLGTDQPPAKNPPLGNSSITVPQPQGTKVENYVQNTQPPTYNNQLNQQYSSSAAVYKNNNKNIDPQDRYESYQNIEDYSAPVQSTFLPQTKSAKGIPGLDLVPDTDKKASGVQSDIIDMTGDYNEGQPNAQAKEPDYNKISKGINSILGDEKIMKMLNMVRGQNIPVDNNSSQNAQENLQSYNRPPVNTSAQMAYSGMTQNNVPQNNQWGNNDNQQLNAQQYPNRQSMPYNNNINNNNNSRSGPPPLMDFSQFNQRRMFEDQSGMLHSQANEQNVGFGQQANMAMPPPPRGGPVIDRSNMRPPLQDVSRQQNMNAIKSGPVDNRLFANRQGMHENNGMHENRPYNNRMPEDQPMPPAQPPKPKWVEEPLFTPSIIVEYEHKPLRLKARDFIEPVHMFDYNHKSKDDEYKRRDFESEADDLFVRKPRRHEDSHFDREDKYATDTFKPREYDRRPREELRDDFRSRYELREEYDDKRRPEALHFERKSRFDDRDRERRREHVRDDYYRDRERDRERERERDKIRETYHSRSRSRDRDSRKRARSRESELSDLSKKSKEIEPKELKSTIKEIPKHIVMIDDILESPGRETRPQKIVIILRGPPGSGKSYLAKLIRDREAEYGGTARIMSIDDYFMQEGEIEETDPVTGKIIKKPTMKYEFDLNLEETYINSLKRAFKRSITDGYFNFLIYDAVNDQLKSYADIWNFARQSGFQVYICTMELDAKVCFKRNIHNRTLDDIEVICSRFFTTPAHHIQLDPTTLLQNAAITDVHMEDAIDEESQDDFHDTEVDNSFTSKWEKMDDAVQLARLDGISKPLRPSQLSMEDYLQLDDWKPNQAKPGKKTVRWADIEERREQEKMRAIGFVVGQTDWNRMTDPTMGSSALTQTKYIERVRRNFN